MSQPPSEPTPALDTKTLFIRHARFVATFLFRLGARASDLEDLVQEVFVIAHRKGGYQPGPASPTSYLARLALEVRLAHRRRNHRWLHSQTVATTWAGAPSATPEDHLRAHQAAVRIQQALDTMDPRTRAVFVLFELEGQSCDSIAAGLELKLGTVCSRLHAARKAFVAYVGES